MDEQQISTAHMDEQQSAQLRHRTLSQASWDSDTKPGLRRSNAYTLDGDIVGNWRSSVQARDSEGSVGPRESDSLSEEGASSGPMLAHAEHPVTPSTPELSSRRPSETSAVSGVGFEESSAVPAAGVVPELAPAQDEDGAEATTPGAIAPKSEAGFAEVLDAILHFLDQYHLRVADLFRSSRYNPSYLEQGDELLTAGELRKLLKNTSLELSAAEARAFVLQVDADGDGQVCIDELEYVLRARRRGLGAAELGMALQERKSGKEVGPGSARAAAPRSPWKLGPQQPCPARIQDLHHMHEEKRLRNEHRKLEREERETRAIEEARLSARPQRAEIDLQAFDPQGLSDRLYRGPEENERRLRLLQQKWLEKEQEDITCSHPKPQQETVLSSKQAEQITNRLYQHHEELEEKRRAALEEQRAHEMAQFDQVGAKALQALQAKRQQGKGQDAGSCHDRLFKGAAEREQKLEAARHKAIVEEKEQLESKMVGKSAVASDPKRIEQLYSDHKGKDQKRSQILAERQQLEEEAIERAVQARRQARERSPQHLRNIRPRVLEPPKGKLESPKLAAQEQERAHKKRSLADPAQLVLERVSSAVAARCGGLPDDKSQKDVAQLGPALKEALQAYRDAARHSDVRGDGSASLKLQKSLRLYSNGILMEDEEGWTRCCMPDVIRQPDSSFDSLMETAEAAQSALMMAVVPEGGDENRDHAQRRWPVGGRHKDLRAGLQAKFGYNPGAKTREAALNKAATLYGPGDRHLCHRHVVDLARISLVFVNSALLRAGLEHIIESFEVVDVRNHYQPCMQNLLGERYVEVLVVLKDGLEMPTVCEIRLEEECFFQAREKAAPHLKEVLEGFRKLYSRPCLNPGCVQYLAQWALQRPKESHSLTVFRRQLARRYGSTVGAWRKAVPTGGRMKFEAFRDICQTMNYRYLTVDYWLSMDPGRAGAMSIFDFDQEAVLLLTRFYAAMLSNFRDSMSDDPNQLFLKLASNANVKPARAGRMDPHEFRLVCMPLGFAPAESERLFSLLDANGGAHAQPPASICVQDIAWLKRLPSYADLRFVGVCRENGGQEDLISWASKRQVASRATLQQSMTEQLESDTESSELPGLPAQHAEPQWRSSVSSGGSAGAEEPALSHSSSAAPEDEEELPEPPSSPAQQLDELVVEPVSAEKLPLSRSSSAPTSEGSLSRTSSSSTLSQQSTASSLAQEDKAEPELLAEEAAHQGAEEEVEESEEGKEKQGDEDDGEQEKQQEEDDDDEEEEEEQEEDEEEEGVREEKDEKEEHDDDDKFGHEAADRKGEEDEELEEVREDEEEEKEEEDEGDEEAAHGQIIATEVTQEQLDMRAEASDGVDPSAEDEEKEKEKEDKEEKEEEEDQEDAVDKFGDEAADGQGEEEKELEEAREEQEEEAEEDGEDGGHEEAARGQIIATEVTEEQLRMRAEASDGVDPFAEDEVF